MLKINTVGLQPGKFPILAVVGIRWWRYSRACQDHGSSVSFIVLPAFIPKILPESVKPARCRVSQGQAFVDAGNAFHFNSGYA